MGILSAEQWIPSHHAVMRLLILIFCILRHRRFCSRDGHFLCFPSHGGTNLNEHSHKCSSWVERVKHLLFLAFSSLRIEHVKMLCKTAQSRKYTCIVHVPRIRGTQARATINNFWTPQFPTPGFPTGHMSLVQLRTLKRLPQFLRKSPYLHLIFRFGVWVQFSSCLHHHHHLISKWRK